MNIAPNPRLGSPSTSLDERAQRRTLSAAGTIGPDVVARRLARDRERERNLERELERRAAAFEREAGWSATRTQPCTLGGW